MSSCYLSWLLCFKARYNQTVGLYNTYVFSARAYLPKDKALVEGAVKIIYTTIFTKINEQVYFSLVELNEAIYILLRDHNNSLLTECGYSQVAAV